MQRFLKLTALVAGLTLMAVSAHTGPSGGAFEIVKSTIDGGGGTSTAANYSVAGTIGQPDAGVLTGGGYTLVGGFWGGAGTPTFNTGQSYFVY
ncbi:MAG: hypothetical protein Kow0059_22650 [Candidatus Sumerlaeia bacterium]